MNEFIKKYRSNVYSQCGEDGIIEECLNRIGIKKGQCVEFGAADGYFCSNTMRLIEQGWKGLMFDTDPGGPMVMHAYITPGNVNQHIPDCDLLSIDIDGNDYNVWDAYNGKPSIVIIEINSSISPDKMNPVSDMKHGTAFLPMLHLGQRKGYFLLGHTGNMVFVDRKYKDLFPEIDERNSETYFDKSWLCENVL